MNTVDEFVALDSKWVAFLSPVLRTLSQGDADAPLWSFAYADLAQEIAVERNALGLEDVSLYGTRHSGASADFANQDRDIAEIQARGQWRSVNSVARYKKAGLLQKTAASYPNGLRRYLATCAEQLADVIVRGAAGPAPFQA